MGPNWDRQDPGGPHVGPMNFAIWGGLLDEARNLPFIMLGFFNGNNSPVVGELTLEDMDVID